MVEELCCLHGRPGPRLLAAHAPASAGCKFAGSTYSMCGPAGALRRSGTTGTQRHASIYSGPIEPARLLFCVRSSVPRSAIIHFSHSEITDESSAFHDSVPGWMVHHGVR